MITESGAAPGCGALRSSAAARARDARAPPTKFHKIPTGAPRTAILAGGLEAPVPEGRALCCASAASASGAGRPRVAGRVGVAYPVRMKAPENSRKRSGGEIRAAAASSSSRAERGIETCERVNTGLTYTHACIHTHVYIYTYNMAASSSPRAERGIETCERGDAASGWPDVCVCLCIYIYICVCVCV